MHYGYFLCVTMMTKTLQKKSAQVFLFCLLLQTVYGNTAIASMNPKRITTAQQDSTTVKQLLKKQYNTDSIYIGATLNFRQLGTAVARKFLEEFTYSTPENCAKQTIVHPSPDKWNWKPLEAYLAFAEKNNITLRIHGPISPQASKWAKTDTRTKEELLQNLEEYFTALCLKINDNPNVKWMDVVNETITRQGEWFREKPGTDKWENPWEQMGHDFAGIPLYILKAFEIAQIHAPKKSLVYNHHGGMEKKMWERVKSTILYLKLKGYRVDGLGWQAHLRSDKPLALDKKSLAYFSELVDWAHQNDLDFHVTEIDYKIWDGKATEKALESQANAYANILKILLSKRKTGVVTYNTWGMVDGVGPHKDKKLFIFDEQLNPKPAVFALRNTLQFPEQKVVLER